MLRKLSGSSEVRAYRGADPQQEAMMHLGVEAHRTMGATTTYESGGKRPRLKLVERGEILYTPRLLERLGCAKIQQVPREIETRVPRRFREPLPLKPLGVVLVPPDEPSTSSKHVLAVQFGDIELESERFAIARAAGSEGIRVVGDEPFIPYMAFGLVEPLAAQQCYAEELEAVLPDEIMFDPGFVTLK